MRRILEVLLDTSGMRIDYNPPEIKVEKLPAKEAARRLALFDDSVSDGEIWATLVDGAIETHIHTANVNLEEVSQEDLWKLAALRCSTQVSLEDRRGAGNVVLTGIADFVLTGAGADQFLVIKSGEFPDDSVMVVGVSEHDRPLGIGEAGELEKLSSAVVCRIG